MPTGCPPPPPAGIMAPGRHQSVSSHNMTYRYLQIRGSGVPNASLATTPEPFGNHDIGHCRALQGHTCWQSLKPLPWYAKSCAHACGKAIPKGIGLGCRHLHRFHILKREQTHTGPQVGMLTSQVHSYLHIQDSQTGKLRLRKDSHDGPGKLTNSARCCVEVRHPEIRCMVPSACASENDQLQTSSADILCPA